MERAGPRPHPGRCQTPKPRPVPAPPTRPAEARASARSGAGSPYPTEPRTGRRRGVPRQESSHTYRRVVERSSPPQVLDWLSKNGWAGRKRSQDRRWIAFALMDENRVRQTQPGPRMFEPWWSCGGSNAGCGLAGFLRSGLHRHRCRRSTRVARQAENVALTRIREWPQIRPTRLWRKEDRWIRWRSRAGNGWHSSSWGSGALGSNKLSVPSWTMYRHEGPPRGGGDSRSGREGRLPGRFDDQRNPIFHITFTHKNGVRGEGLSDKQVARKMAAKSYMSRTDVSFPSTRL